MTPLTQTVSASSTAGPASDVGSNISEKSIKSDAKYFNNPKYAKLGVKGNFMPLAAKPANMDLADWLAHQGDSQASHLITFKSLIGQSSVVENFRLLNKTVAVIQEVNHRTGKPTCSSESCPKMSAGPYVTSHATILIH